MLMKYPHLLLQPHSPPMKIKQLLAKKRRSDQEGTSIIYSISGSEININSSTGVLTFASAPDYENKTSYSATVTATDGTFSPTPKHYC